MFTKHNGYQFFFDWQRGALREGIPNRRFNAINLSQGEHTGSPLQPMNMWNFG